MSMLLLLGISPKLIFSHIYIYMEVDSTCSTISDDMVDPTVVFLNQPAQRIFRLAHWSSWHR